MPKAKRVFECENSCTKTISNCKFWFSVEAFMFEMELFLYILLNRCNIAKVDCQYYLKDLENKPESAEHMRRAKELLDVDYCSTSFIITMYNYTLL